MASQNVFHVCVPSYKKRTNELGGRIIRYFWKNKMPPCGHKMQVVNEDKCVILMLFLILETYY